MNDSKTTESTIRFDSELHPKHAQALDTAQSRINSVRQLISSTPFMEVPQGLVSAENSINEVLKESEVKELGTDE